MINKLITWLARSQLNDFGKMILRLEEDKLQLNEKIDLLKKQIFDLDSNNYKMHMTIKKLNAKIKRLEKKNG